MSNYSSDDDDAPEAVSLQQSKKIVQSQSSALQQAEGAERQKKREKNRERDQKLKEQAAAKKGKRKVVEQKEADEDEEDDDEDEDEDEDGDDAIMARMRRAMEDAGGESDEDAEMGDGDDSESEESEEDFHGFDAPQQRMLRKNPNYLPDHLFASASASQSKPPSNVKSRAKQHREKQRTKKKARAKPKDIILGSRTVRSLADSDKPAATTGMAPSTKVKKFLDRTMAFKSGKATSRGWQRQPASVGSLKTSGPAARFVRS